MENSDVYIQSNNYYNNQSNIQCNISQVLGAIKNKKDARWFCLMNLKFLLILELYMPEFSCYDFEYFLQVANGSKKVLFLILASHIR